MLPFSIQIAIVFAQHDPLRVLNQCLDFTNHCSKKLAQLLTCRKFKIFLLFGGISGVITYDYLLWYQSTKLVSVLQMEALLDQQMCISLLHQLNRSTSSRKESSVRSWRTSQITLQRKLQPDDLQLCPKPYSNLACSF